MTGNPATLLRQAAADATDRDLLGRFAAARDEAAFAELVRRHGRLVLGVCRRVTGHPQDAEDAFQAVFLILATKAASVARPEALGNWLFGVAVRVARKARRAAARRRAREVQGATMPQPAVPAADPWADLWPLLDGELAALPEHYRAAVLLCDLQQKSRAEAAAALGIPEGTLSSRLNAGRKRLAERLARRGVELPAAAVGAVLGGSAAADVPPDLVRRAVTAGVGGLTGGAVPPAVKTLATDGGATMGRVIGAVVVAVGLAAGAVGTVAAWPGDDPDAPRPEPARVEDQKPDAGPNPEPAAAKRPAVGKPKLVQLRDVSAAGGLPTWSPDGSVLVISMGERLDVLDGRTLATRAQLRRRDAGTVVGFTREKPALVTYLSGPRKINTLTQLRVWAALTSDRPDVRDAPTRAVELDPDDGRPVAVLPDGSAVVAQAFEVKTIDDAPKVVATRFRLIDAATGEAGREVARVDGYTPGFALTPDGRRLVVASYTDKGRFAVSCFDVATGKGEWGTTFAESGSKVADRLSPDQVVTPSPDGKLLAVTVPRPAPAPAGVSAPMRFGGPPGLGRSSRPESVPEVVLLDAADGAQVGALGDGAWSGLGFSHDGRLFAGRDPGRSRLRVWDVRGRTPVKTWEGSAEAVFAPDRPTLAVLESYTEQDPGEPNRFVTRATLGLWDVSGLAK